MRQRIDPATLVGKTILGVEDVSQDNDGTVLMSFTDGTAVLVAGGFVSGYGNLSFIFADDVSFPRRQESA